MDGRILIYFVESGVYLVLAVVAFVLEAWAFFDCLRHKANAFEAVSKRTKSFWLALTGGAFAVGLFSLLSQLGSGGGASSLGIFGLAAVTAASVYLADVRPAVKDAGRGRGSNMGPYGPW